MKARLAKARPLRRLAMLPAVKSLILKSERSRTGKLALHSDRAKMIIRRKLRAIRLSDSGSVTLPNVSPRSRRVMDAENVTAPGRSNLSPRAGCEISFSLFLDQ